MLGDARIRYVRNERNLGIAANFNRCLELGAAEAEIVAVFHADDELEPGYVAAMRGAHGRFPAATCVAPRVEVIGSDGHPIRTMGDSVKQLMWPRRLPATFTGDRGLAHLMHGLFFYCPSVSYRVALLPELRFDPRWRQVMDLDLYARVLLEGGSIVFDARTRVPLSPTRRHDDGAELAVARAARRGGGDLSRGGCGGAQARVGAVRAGRRDCASRCASTACSKRCGWWCTVSCVPVPAQLGGRSAGSPTPRSVRDVFPPPMREQ